MTDPYVPFAIVAALSAAGAFAFEDTSVRAKIGIGPSVAESPYGISGEAFRPKPAPLGPTAQGATIVEATIPRNLPSNANFAIVTRARQEVDHGVKYDASYRMLPSYPNGDIPGDRGACTDLVVRAFRAVQVDLQVLVHEDMVADPGAYGGAEPDANVDHRRVPTLFTYFDRNTVTLPLSPKTSVGSFQPGDIVFYAWKKRCTAAHPCPPEHVALVSNETGPRGLPLIIQNGGPRATESDVLDHGMIVGHFRFPNTVPRTTPAAAPNLNTPSPAANDPVAAPVPVAFLAGPKPHRRQ